MDMAEVGETLVDWRAGASGVEATGVGTSGVGASGAGAGAVGGCRAGLLSAGSCCEALAWLGGGMSEVDTAADDSAAAAAAATTAAAADTTAPSPPAMAHFIRAASFHKRQKRSNVTSSVHRQCAFQVGNGELTWSSHAFFSFSCASLLFFSSCSFSTAARALACAFGI